ARQGAGRKHSMISFLLKAAGIVHLIIAALPFVPFGQHGESVVTALTRPYNPYSVYGRSDPWGPLAGSLGDMAIALIALHLIVWISFALISFGVAVAVDNQAGGSARERRPKPQPD